MTNPKDLTTAEGVLGWAQDCEPRQNPYGDFRQAQYEARLRDDVNTADYIAGAVRAGLIIEAAWEWHDAMEKAYGSECFDGGEHARVMRDLRTALKGETK